MFLLVPAYPESPGPKAVVTCVLCDVHAFISKMVHFEHVMSHVEVSVQG